MTNSEKQIELVKEQLDKAQTEDTSTNEKVMELKSKLCSALRDEELFWKQKSRSTWLKEGDQNTKFFHASTKQRRARNRITKLKRPDGLWAEKYERIEHTTTEYFQELFYSSRPHGFDEALRFVTAKVTPEMNISLTTTT